MPIPRALISIASFGALAACSGSGSRFGNGSDQPIPTVFTAKSVFQHNVDSMPIGPTRAASTVTHVFVSNAANDDILIYNERGQKVGKIGGISHPGALAADVAENLYVLSGSTVEILKKPYTKKPFALGGSGDGVAASLAGLVAVWTLISHSGGSGSVSFYKSGASTPCNTLSAFAKTYFAAFDTAGNLFIDGFDANDNVLIGEIVGGCNAKRVRALTVANVVGFPGDIAVDESDQIAIGDQFANALYTYAQPKNGSLGSPITTTAVPTSDLAAFVLANSGHDFWGIDAGSASASEFAYPAGGSALQTLDPSVHPSGIAVTPIVKP